MPVPSAMSDIDAAFLTEALGVNVTHVRSERIAVGEGFLGELARMYLTSSDDAAPATVIAKIPTTDSGLKPLGLMLGLYERESKFYAEVAPKLQINVPSCLYNDGDGENFLLILEDVGHLDRGDHLVGATLAQAEAAIDAAAGVHGRWWKSPELDELPWIPAIDNPINLSLQALFEQSWPMVVDQYSHHFDKQLINAVEEFLPTCTDSLTHFGELSVTLVHNDFRLDNMFFGGNAGSEMTLIDWQLIGKGDGGGDLVPFLMGNMGTDLRRANETSLLRRYYEAMHAQGAGYAKFDDVADGLGRSMMFWLVAWGNSAVTAGVSNDRAAKLFENVMQRVTTAASDHEAWQYTGDHTWMPEFL